MYDMINIFEVFLPQLLRYPNPTDPLNGEAAALLMREPVTYESRVKGVCVCVCFFFFFFFFFFCWQLPTYFDVGGWVHWWSSARFFWFIRVHHVLRFESR